MIGFLILFLSLILLIIGARMLLKGVHRAKSEKVLSKFDQYIPTQEEIASQDVFFITQLKSLGVYLNFSKIVALLAATALLAFIASFFFDLIGAVFVFVCMPVVVCLVIKFRYQKRVARMVEQLPMFLDRSVRGLMSGRTLGNAIIFAMENVPAPLGDAFIKTRREVDNGVPIQDAVTDFAEFYKRDEFRILALGLRVNAQYGGNSSELLKSLVVLIRDKDKMVRSLRAMTGETRLSAVVLASMPAGLATYLMLTNPGFFMGLWEDSLGKILLFVAFGLQILGSAIMWRMLRSIK